MCNTPPTDTDKKTHIDVITRDFYHNSNLKLDSETLDVLGRLYEKMINLKDTNYETFSDGVVIDTCYFFRGIIPKNQKIIITDGVILEILQGSIYNNLDPNQSNYLRDLERLLNIKRIMGNNCIFLNLNCKSRKYYPKFQNTHSLRRNVDSELLSFTLLINEFGHTVKLATFDKELKLKISSRSGEKSILYNVSYRKPCPTSIAPYRNGCITRSSDSKMQMQKQEEELEGWIRV
jgi:hypothetical protein